MDNALDIIHALGEKQIADAAGVTVYSVRKARTNRRFPASWFPIIRALGARHGLKIGEGPFAFKPRE